MKKIPERIAKRNLITLINGYENRNKDMHVTISDLGSGMYEPEIWYKGQVLFRFKRQQSLADVYSVLKKHML